MAIKSDKDKNAPSVINIIQEMLQNGESEEKIYKTLREIGISEEQIKNLLLISKSNTFTLLKSEVSKTTIESLEREMPNYRNKLFEEVKKYNESTIKNAVMTDLAKKQDLFEQKQLKELDRMVEVVDGAEATVRQQKDDIIRLDTRIEEIALGSTKKMFILRILGFIVGLILLSATIYKFATLGFGASLDFLILYVISVIAGIILLIITLM